MSETHWVDSNLVSFSSYNSFVKNRADKNSGGVAILVKKSLSASLVHIPDFAHFECVSVALKLPDGRDLYLVSVYCPKGDAEHSEVDSLLSVFKNLCIVSRDFNAHNRLWEYIGPSKRNGSSIGRYITSNSDFVLWMPPNLPTRVDPASSRHSTIDLSFASTDIAHLTHISLCPSTWDSDHTPICISVNLKQHLLPEPPPTWNFDNNKWGAWNAYMERKLKDLKFCEIIDPETAYQVWYGAIIDSSKKFFKFSSGKKTTRENQAGHIGRQT